ncbi:phosphoenolpyruvate--protein phosphotransferase [Fusibacter paucivorans]|uniref:Phosphoenolpyruvate-protein phosphotransferase n=1 Tax=Fusibacter paucivorans TaxID=76009 RepID=A0ABS5PKR6_9FIRM|nr:phosphoenolpyruvate--protein phosphotransferase [Fusibacter paucivorans]MBS7525457.1 phosphoenolpyruvate--protein phosphotransferase [Fusibacter paucivorans]
MNGIAASDGIGIGKARIVNKPIIEVTKQNKVQTDVERQKLTDAVAMTEKQLKNLEDVAKRQIGEDEAKVFEAHQMILQDPEWMSSIEQILKEEKCDAAYATDKATRAFIQIFEGIDDAYIKERVADLRDVSHRLLSNMLGIDLVDYSLIQEDTILVGRDFEPSDTVGFTNPFIKGFITEIGSASSHSAIIAKTMGLPAVIGVPEATKKIEEGIQLIIDGGTGEVFESPSTDMMQKLTTKLEQQKEEAEALKKLITAESMTIDGIAVEISGNIANPKDAVHVMENGGDGVGLFRSEFLFMDRETAPTENEQFEAYKRAAEILKGKPLIVRTLDAGGDKHVPYLNIASEMNPFLGYRAIRICLDRDDLFQTQLRAILRASHYGFVKIMFPMIATYDELRSAKEAVQKAKETLKKLNQPYDEAIQVGIMVEVPSAAAIADILATEADFMSIGTNDLTQYVMAADRMNELLGNLNNTFHPAVLRMIYQTIKACKNAGKMVGMCGEAAGDKLLIPLLLGMGLEEFSMSPTKILKSREIIRRLDTRALGTLVDTVMALKTADEIKAYLETFSRRL